MALVNDEEAVSSLVMRLVDYDLGKLDSLANRLRDEFKLAEDHPVFMQDILDYLRGRYQPR